MAAWHLHHGDWWMVQWSWNGWLSLGVHVDWRRRPVGEGRTFGPYVDLHLGPVILSVGNNPVYTSSFEMGTSTCRGGISDGNGSRDAPALGHRAR